MFSCAQSDNAIDQVLDNLTTGAALRTITIKNLVVDTSDLSRPITLTLEYQNGADPTGLESVNLFITFEDRTLENGNSSRPKQLFRTLEIEDFTAGPNGFLRTEIVISTDALFTAFSLDSTLISCTDKFVLDLDLNQTNGQTFNNGNTSLPIVGLGSAIDSPFSYDIYVVETVFDDLFTGGYGYTSIQDGFAGPTFREPEVVQLRSTRPNTRRFSVIRDSQESVMGGVLLRAEIEFTIACDQAILTRYVRSAIGCAAGIEGDVHVLLGPAQNLDNTVSSFDDSVFNLKFLESFEGRDGFCGWPLTESEIQFSKQ